MSRNFSRTAHHINANIGKAIQDHQMIGEGDRILIAVSGGKDSLTLLHFLSRIRTWSPVHFDVHALHVRADFQCGGCVLSDDLPAWFQKIGVPYTFKDIRVLDEHKRTSCFWCAWNRRKTLFETAVEVGCNKIAFGHHKDDIIETILMNMIFNGHLGTMNPKQEMFGGKLALIRPLCYVEEAHIRRFAQENKFPEAIHRCPFAADSKRKYMKEFIQKTHEAVPGINIRSNIYRSFARPRAEYMQLKDEC